jgi:L-iditol 2-dehydrogenase
MLNFPFHEHQCLTENLEYIKQGLIDPKDFYSHVLPLEEVNTAMELVVSKKAIKVILTID